MTAPAWSRVPAPAVLLAAILVLLAGCARWPEQTHTQYEVGGPAKLRPAADGGLYAVQWSATPTGPRRPVPAAERVVGQGATIGFAPDDAGRVLAVAGDERFALAGLPEQARYCFWATRVPPRPRPDPPAAAAGRHLADALRTVGGIGLVLAVAMLDSALADLDDREPGDRRGYRLRHDRDDDDNAGRGEPPPTPSAPAGRGRVPWQDPPTAGAP